ncbi:MAG: glycosyltransferase, partial [Candidatus Odinarchaeia archaeon]
KLESLALELSINKLVDFVGFKSNPYSWIAKADLFVLASDTEGFPVVILEAMACGVPIISTDCLSGPNEIITNGKNGILVPVDNEKVLKDQMLNLLNDQNLRKMFSIEGKKRAENFRIEKILQEYEELF